MYELLELNAIEAVPVIREAFRADGIDETIAGDWGDVRRELKIERQPDDPPEGARADAMRQKYPALYEASGFPRGGSSPMGPHRSIEQRKEADRKRRKRQKQARRQNRKRH